jgi:hypothetical protein
MIPSQFGFSRRYHVIDLPVFPKISLRITTGKISPGTWKVTDAIRELEATEWSSNGAS